MGETQNQPFQLSFNPSLKVDFQGSRFTFDGGLLLVRELDERLGLSELIAEHLTDSRGKGKQAVKMTRLYCHRFRSNQVRLALSLLAYNLGNLWRRLALPKRIENWSLTSLQPRLVKTRWAAGETCAALLASAGGEPSDEAAVWKHGAADRGAGRGKRVNEGWETRIVVDIVRAKAVRGEVCAQAAGSGSLLGRTREMGVSAEHHAVQGPFPEQKGEEIAGFSR